MRRAVLALALAGCAGHEKPVAEFGAGACDARKADVLVGRVADAATVAEARRLSGSKVARAIAPGAMVTMDYRTDRVNLKVDARRTVIGVHCG